MCDPITITAVIGAVAGGASTYQQQQQAEAQTKAQYEIEVAQTEANNAAARDQANLEYANQRLTSLRESTQISGEREELARAALNERATILAQGAESGVGGVSLQRSFISSAINEGSQSSVISTKDQFNRQQQSLQQSATGLRLASNLRGGPAKPFKQSGLSRALQIGTGASRGAATGASLANKFKTNTGTGAGGKKSSK